MRDGITDDKVHMLRYEMATCNAMGMCTKQQGLRKGGGGRGGEIPKHRPDAQANNKTWNS